MPGYWYNPDKGWWQPEEFMSVLDLAMAFSGQPGWLYSATFPEDISGGDGEYGGSGEEDRKTAEDVLDEEDPEVLMAGVGVLAFLGPLFRGLLAGGSIKAAIGKALGAVGLGAAFATFMNWMGLDDDLEGIVDWVAGPLINFSGVQHWVVYYRGRRLLYVEGRVYFSRPGIEVKRLHHATLPMIVN